MSRLTADVLYGVTGQTVEVRVMEGRPTSATFDVFNDTAGDDDTAEFSGAATVDSVNTTVSSASGPSQADPQKLSLTSTTSIVTSRKYLLSEGSRQEWVQPVEIVSGSYIRVRHPLKNDYTTAATLVSTTLTAAIDSTWVADLGNISDASDPNPGYRVRWEIVVGGVTYVQYTYFDLVRAKVTHQVDIDDLNARAPGLEDGMPTEYRVEDGRPLIDTAWRSVKTRLAALGIDTDALRDNEILDELVILRSLNLIARGGWAPGAFQSVTEYINATQAEYDRVIEQHFAATLKHKLDTGTSGAADRVFDRAVWSK